MNDEKKPTPTPETCARTILEMSGAAFEPDIAAGLWSKMRERVPPSLSDEMIEAFEKDCINYSRV